jgi:small GTP-binding protein
MRARKICMMGDFAVGKTSLVTRFVSGAFGEQYLTTVGVKIDTKVIGLPSGDRLKLVLWDIAGKSEFAPVDTSYLKDASGYLLVVDGTRPATLQSAIDLQSTAAAQLGAVPFSVLINKADLADRWAVSADDAASLDALGWPVSRTSALSGAGVEKAFSKLGARLAHRL